MQQQITWHLPSITKLGRIEILNRSSKSHLCSERPQHSSGNEHFSKNGWMDDRQTEVGTLFLKSKRKDSRGRSSSQTSFCGASITALSQAMEDIFLRGMEKEKEMKAKERKGRMERKAERVANPSSLPLGESRNKRKKQSQNILPFDLFFFLLRSNLSKDRREFHRFDDFFVFVFVFPVCSSKEKAVPQFFFGEAGRHICVLSFFHPHMISSIISFSFHPIDDVISRGTRCIDASIKE